MKVAILMSTFNGERHLIQQVESIRAQDYTEWHLYIRDDVSSDQTKSIINDLTKKYRNITSIEDDDGNLGPARSFFKLLSEVNAEYYMFCDQDDVWFSDKISASLEMIKKQEEIDPEKPLLVITDAKVTDENLNVISESFWDYNKFPPALFAKNPDFINVFNAAPGCTMLFNHKLKEILPLTEKNVLMHDWLVMIHALRKNALLILDKPTLFYRQHNLNAVGASKVNMTEKIKLLLFSSKERQAKERAVYHFVEKYTGISKFKFYFLKLKFNIFRYIS